MNTPQYHIGHDSVSVVKGGESITIDDRDVQGVSTRIVSSGSWIETEPARRIVNIEFRCGKGSIRTATIEEVVSKHGEDRLAVYARRVSHFAAKNCLQELLENESVERNGFMINDQGVLITGSGVTLCCGLFDMVAIETAGDRTLIWSADSPEPAAILRMDDPNSLAVSKLLAQLVREPDDDRPTEFRHVIGHFKCDPRGGTSIQSIKFAASIFAVVAGAVVSLVTRNMMGGPNLPAAWLLPVAVPVLIGLVLAGVHVLRAAPRLIVFRRGLCIERNKAISELPWSEITSMRVAEQQINIGNDNTPRYIPLFTLHVHTLYKQFFGRHIKLSWMASTETATVTEFLQHKDLELQSPSGDAQLEIESADAADSQLAVV